MTAMPEHCQTNPTSWIFYSLDDSSLRCESLLKDEQRFDAEYPQSQIHQYALNIYAPFLLVSRSQTTIPATLVVRVRPRLKVLLSFGREFQHLQIIFVY
jgi:hypothetical protein